MAKNKNSKRGNLKKGKGGQKKKSSKPKQFTKPSGATPPLDNPFELRVNKAKHDNLGRRGRNEQGVPGISRSRAVEKRKATLLQEYKVRNKTNVLQDNRIGEKRKGMPEEEKIIRRSAAEKARQFKQKSIFNLQDTEDFLTHRGKPLVDIDRYEDPRDGSDSEDERLDADFVSDANFGGFMKIKTPEESQLQDYEVDEEGKPKSHKQIIQELIMDSKRKKFEKAKEADENYELVCKLDDEFKNPDIRNLLLLGGGKKNKSEPEPQPSGEKEDYDKIVRELQFETKTGRATDRLKTEEEVAVEEKEKLEQLEKERLKRMQMTDNDSNSNRQHRSADDLDDGYEIDLVEKRNKGSEDEDEGEEGEDDEEEEENSDDESDQYSDVEESEGEDNQDEEDDNKNKTNDEEEGEEIKNAADEFLEIPFVINIPVKYKEFEAMLKKYKAHYKFKRQQSSLEALNIILTRIVKYNKASDRSRLPKLFNFVVRYILDLSEKSGKLSKYLLKVCNITLPHLHSLLLLNPNECMAEIENGEIFDDFYPIKNAQFHKIMYFHICSQLFSVTDFNHRVMSSVKARLLEILNQTKATNINILAKLLFVIKIIHRTSSEARRYTPEVINILGSILQCYTGTENRWTGFAVPTIRHAKSFLFISVEECSASDNVDDELYKFVSDEAATSSSIQLPTKLGILNTTLLYVNKFVNIYERLPSSIEIFHHIKKTLVDLNGRSWPKPIADRLSTTLTAISEMKQKKETLVIQESNKPKILKLYEPLIEEDFDGIRKKKAPKGKQETARLSHKVKQEMKNAVREIRKDTAFLAKQQLREQLDRDSERKRKVKEIMSSLANQEGDYQKSKKFKK